MEHHGAGLLRITGSSEFVNALRAGNDAASLTPAERSMLGYARKLSIEPRSITENDVLQLRQCGLSDLAIIEINLCAAYMNFVNRIAEGLGVNLEPSFSNFTR